MPALTRPVYAPPLFSPPPPSAATDRQRSRSRVPEQTRNTRDDVWGTLVDRTLEITRVCPPPISRDSLARNPEPRELIGWE